MSAIDMIKLDQERQTRMFERMMETFLKEWMPEDHYMAIDFERDFHMLVRQIYRDAQEPLLDHITKLALSIPMFPQRIIPDGPANVR